MIITLTGAHSTGKSSLLLELKKYACFENYSYSDNITRDLAKKGFKINEQGDNITQLLIMNGHIENAYVENALLGRCVLDGLCYTQYMYKYGSVERWVYQYATKVCQLLLPRYNYIFYIEPEFKIENDGTRSVEKEFQKKIVKIFKQNILKFNVNIMKIGGTVQERCQQILETVK